ncbi:MAG: SUMF1/EgtB/PvdO family nonheme iron enzyme [bacterium]|nr:SUMF1/EgtB/PvdO family nonheme iron enzyme [bacterium]
MAKSRPLRWLHISDLHLGCRGTELWWQVWEDFEKSIREMVARLGAPDLLLLTGDLTNRGRTKEFKIANRFLDALLKWLSDAGGPEPLIIPVPGNHDLIRPQGMDALPYRVFESYDQGADDKGVRMLDEKLWTDRDASFVKPLFKDYLTWLGRRIVPGLKQRGATVHRSHFPGDLCVELEIPGTFPLCIVGLNSAWLQYSDAEFEGKLALPVPQFHAALPAARDSSPIEVFQRCRRALLLMHHPPGWLSKRARGIFRESIYEPRRFDLCLYGHMHEARTESVAISGGTPRHYFQAPSLFGLEDYGSANESRAMGYAWGSLSADGEVRIRPLERVTRGDGTGAFVHDHAFPEEPDGVVIRSAQAPRPAPGRKKPRPAELGAYLEDLVDRTDRIDVGGISAAGKVKGALRPPIERLYTPLRSRAEPLRALGDAQDAARLAGDGGLVGLAEVLPRFTRLLIEGQPGAGKTTFLRFAACMLARDALGIEGPEGGSWSRHYLGLPAPEQPPVPVLVRIADLVMMFEESGTALRRDDCQRLLELLESWCAVNGHPVDQEDWGSLFEDGEAILLLDGLDEVADERLRSRVLAIFRDACRCWKCPIVVASRPTQTAALREMGFHTTTIEPFSDAEIRIFVDQWVAALHDAESAADLGGEGHRYRDRLLGAIMKRPRVRRLATNPVMLTCLCVVHWNEGQLPEGRSRVYRAVVRWLIAARTELREQQGLTDRFAWRAFARLALAMVNAEKGKRSIFDLEDGAVAVDAVVRRDFSELEPEDRRHRAREWLRFECLGSGIVEEVAGNRIRFWHLTFQEFLAALQLAWRSDGEHDAAEDWWPLVRERLDHAQWRETIELFPGCLLDEGGEGRVDKLLDRVLALRGPAPDLATEARIAGIVGRLLQPLTVYHYRPRAEIAAAYEAALERSMAIFTVEGAGEVPVKDRIAVAEALGQGGDPRLAAERDNFIEVPGCDGLQLGKYPVTVEEYQRFVEHRGYEEEEKYWGAEGWSLRSKERWEQPGDWDDQLTTPNRPVVGVSWYEAMAYCRWLSEQQSQEVRLPSEDEWEKAATPVKGEYPWGEEEPDAERANFAPEWKSNVGSPTPVGVYPAGDGPHGHSDLAGNVLEWCVDEVPVKDEELWRSVRGGGWYGSAEVLRSASHGGYPAGRRGGLLGFRVAVAPASL